MSGAEKGYTTGRRVAAYRGAVLTDAELGRIEPLIMAAEATIDGETGRSWLGGAIEDEAHPLYGPAIWLDNKPVASIQSVAVRTLGLTSTTVLVADSTYYVRDLNAGALWVPCWDTADELLVSYTPTASVPADLGLAATMLVAYWLRPAFDGISTDVKSYQIPGDISVTFRDDAVKGGLPDDVRAILARYRSPVVFA